MANTCIAGDHNGEITVQVKRKVTSLVINHNQGFFKGIKKVLVNKETVESYEVVGEESNKSMSSGIARGAVGAALLGGIGAIAGASSGKKKGLYTVSIVFKDGTKCLCELDDAMYKNLVVALY